MRASLTLQDNDGQVTFVVSTIGGKWRVTCLSTESEAHCYVSSRKDAYSLIGEYLLYGDGPTDSLLAAFPNLA